MRHGVCEKLRPTRGHFDVVRFLEDELGKVDHFPFSRAEAAQSVGTTWCCMESLDRGMSL